ncbi:MAG: lipopolysaccharide biosynthesis protein [Pseudomonadota bacterium]
MSDLAPKTVAPMQSAPVIQLPSKKTDTGLPTKPIKKIARLTTIKPKVIRRNLTLVSFVLCVVIPSILCGFYFLAVASDRYAASAGFAVRTLDSSAAGGDFLGALTGVSTAGSTTTDSYIIMEYLTSRQLVEQLMKDADFLNAYSRDDIDFLYRLDPEMPIEDIVNYWSWMITPSYDNTSGLVEFEVEAFTIEDAKRVADLIVRYCQELINRISEQARRDSVRFAEREVSTAELNLKLIRDELRDYRARTAAIDPEAEAGAQIELTTRLKSEIINVKSRLSSALSSGLATDSPTVRNLTNQLNSLEHELEIKEAEMLAADGGDLATILAELERLQVEQEFGQQAYTVALASLERSRAEADRNQRFLAIYRQPSAPQDAIYPERILNTFLCLIVALIIWSLGLLLVQSVRDHMR